MGLDIYLSKTQLPAAKFIELNDQFDAESEMLEGDTGKDEIGKRLGLVLDKYGDPETESVSFTSTKVPDLEVGYFRSSYNDASPHSRLRAMGLGTLYDVFSVDREQYYVLVDWADAKAKATELRNKFAAAHGESDGATVIDASHLLTPPKDVNSYQKALEIYNEQREAKKAGKTHFDNYSNGLGSFFFSSDKMVLRALIPGFSHFNLPCVYAIVEPGGTTEDDCIYQLLTVVIETCDYVLDQSDAETYFLAWSG